MYLFGMYIVVNMYVKMYGILYFLGTIALKYSPRMATVCSKPWQFFAGD